MPQDPDSPAPLLGPTPTVTPAPKPLPEPAISVVCSWYNRAEFLDDTIASLLNQEECPDYEVILVNDGSPDPRVRQVLDRWSHPRLTILHKENGGFVSGIRLAISHARGRYLAIMGAGDVCLPLRLARQRAYLDANPHIALTGCGYEDRIQDETGAWRHVKTYRNPPPRDLADLQRFNPYSQGETMFRRDVYEKTGGYREFFFNSQDIDMWLRMIEHAPLGQIQEVLYHRRIFEDGVTGSVDKMLRQSFFSSTAIEMSKMRQAGRKDLVELYGQDAKWMRPRTRRSARRLMIAGLVHHHRGDHDRAALLLEMSGKEHPLYAVVSPLLRLALAAPPSTGLPRLAMKIAAKASPAIGRFTGVK